MDEAKDRHAEVLGARRSPLNIRHFPQTGMSMSRSPDAHKSCSGATRLFIWIVMNSVRLLSALPNVAVFGTIALLVVAWNYGADLPDHRWLVGNQLPEGARLYAADGTLVAEYARQRRIVVPLGSIPVRVIDAFLAAEDKTFFTHLGIDIPGVVRAAVWNLNHSGNGVRPRGASTITQQVARNFLLTNEPTLRRKIREAILALRLERTLGKTRILELYLNAIYLGRGSYGVAAASLSYFNKPLSDLTVAEAAFLAALPKAPNQYSAAGDQATALSRRNWVIHRMLDDGRISSAKSESARAEPLQTIPAANAEIAPEAAYFTEEVRRQLIQLHGADGVYQGGLSVRTTLDPRMQHLATEALQNGLLAYDRRHGWRGPLRRIDLAGTNWTSELARLEMPAGGLPGWRLATVLSADERGAVIGLADGERGNISWCELRWARPWREGQRVGPEPGSPSDALSSGDVVLVEPIDHEGSYALRQIPEIRGAIVAMEPHSGRILAMTGGWSFADSEFNRAVQAWRQPGSTFKPFVVLAALDRGFVPSTIILDAPIALPLGAGRGLWHPANYSNRYAGPRTLRFALEHSRNVMIVRVARRVGMDAIADYAERFGIVDSMPREIAMAIGSGETTLLRMTNAYAMLANGGHLIRPTLIDRVQDRNGHTVYRNDDRPCPACSGIAWRNQDPPGLPDTREQIADPASVYQVVSMLEGVVERGTGRRVREPGRPIAGKTGTTNESRDAWFIGFTPDLVVGVYTGFDEPRSLGPRETGSSVAAPIFGEFMGAALAGVPARLFRIPNGVRFVRVRLSDGRPAQSGDTDVIWEAFRPEPQQTPPYKLATRSPFDDSPTSGSRTESPITSALMNGIGVIY